MVAVVGTIDSCLIWDSVAPLRNIRAVNSSHRLVWPPVMTCSRLVNDINMEEMHASEWKENSKQKIIETQQQKVVRVAEVAE